MSSIREINGKRKPTMFAAAALAMAIVGVTVSASSTGGGITITTYTGGCRAGVIDVNPQLSIARGWVFVDMYATLYDGRGRILATSRGYGNASFPYRSYYGPATVKTPRWYTYAPRGGQYVKIFIKNSSGQLVVHDTATCRT
jgi:hypothetical protein